MSFFSGGVDGAWRIRHTAGQVGGISRRFAGRGRAARALLHEQLRPLFIVLFSTVAEGPSVRPIIGITLLMLGVGTLSCQWDMLSARPPADASPVRWVRTVDGWEQYDVRQTSVVQPPGLHPLVLAAGQGMFSLLALAAFGRRDEVVC